LEKTNTRAGPLGASQEWKNKTAKNKMKQLPFRSTGKAFFMKMAIDDVGLSGLN
jgi:hypothetical protein